MLESPLTSRRSGDEWRSRRESWAIERLSGAIRPDASQGAALLGASAFGRDALDGLPFTRAARSWAAWAIGLVLLGVIDAIGEAAFERATENDRQHHPLRLRLARLLLGLLLGAAALYAAWWTVTQLT
jgi:hypothetical protein